MVGNPLYSMPKDLQENGKEKLLTICFYFHRYRKYFCGWVHLKIKTYSNTVLLKWNTYLVLWLDNVCFEKSEKFDSCWQEGLKGEKIGGICYFYAYSTILCFTTFLIAIYDYLPYKCTQKCLNKLYLRMNETQIQNYFFLIETWLKV